MCGGKCAPLPRLTNPTVVKVCGSEDRFWYKINFQLSQGQTLPSVIALRPGELTGLMINTSRVSRISQDVEAAFEQQISETGELSIYQRFGSQQLQRKLLAFEINAAKTRATYRWPTGEMSFALDGCRQPIVALTKTPTPTPTETVSGGGGSSKTETATPEADLTKTPEATGPK